MKLYLKLFHSKALYEALSVAPCEALPAAEPRDTSPVPTHGGDGLEAAGRELVGAIVAAVHRPVEEVHLLGVELQQQDDHLTAQLVDLGEPHQTS